MNEQKKLHRIMYQTVLGQNVQINTPEITSREARVLAEKETPRLAQEFIIQPLCTQEEWDEGMVLFCPRCGQKFDEPQVPSLPSRCYGCNSDMLINLETNINASDDEEETP